MMFTPTPPARRPRPPSSQNRMRAKMAAATAPPRDATLTVGIVERGETDTPLSAYLFKRKESDLARITASPGDIGDVSLTLDMPREAELRVSTSSSVALAMIAGDQAQPSPPPPYDRELPTSLQPSTDGAVTPPRQDSGLPSRRPSSDPGKDADALDLSQVEEHLRLGRAPEAARSLGLDMDFENERTSSTESNQPPLSPQRMKKQLRDAKLRLQQRDNELVMAAKVAEQVLKSHEALLAALPGNLKSQLPHLLSLHTKGRGHHRKASSTSSAASQFEEHLVMSPVASSSTTPIQSPTMSTRRHAKRRSIPLLSPFPRGGGTSRSPGTTLRLYQIESDERIAALEQLLADAHESEEAQRKQAARLRKDLNKLQREYSAAETRYAEDRSIRVTARAATRDGGWRSRQATIDKDLRSAYRAQLEEDEREVADTLAWETRPGPSRRQRSSMSSQSEEDIDQVAHDLSNLSVGTMRGGPSMSRGSAVQDVMQGDDAESFAAHAAVETQAIAARRQVSRQTSQALLSSGVGKLRKKVSASSFLSPPRTLRRSRSPGTPPSILLSASKASISGGTVRTAISIRAPSTRSSRASKRTPYPSPTPSLLVAPPTDSPSPSPSRYFRSPSAALSSLSARLGSLRQLVTGRLGRSLGSELGSAFGDASPSPSSRRSGKARQYPEDDGGEWTDEEILSEEGLSPAPLPPGASAALSSLALALAPSHIFPSSSAAADARLPILPKGALREPGLDNGTYELLAEAVKHRKLKWVESTTPPLSLLHKGKGKRKSTPTLASSTRALPLLGSLEWAPVDPWEAGEYSDEISDLGSARRPPRPELWRNASSSSTIALAHRRLNVSQQGTMGDSRSQRGDGEVRTVPGRVVNDMVAIVAITLEWIEVLAIIVIKVGMDVRYNHRTTINWRRSDGQPRRTYYF